MKNLLRLDVSDMSTLFAEIYRQKLQQCVADGELNDEDVAALLRLRVMLCVSQQTVEAAHSDICGSLFEKVAWFLSIFLCRMRILVTVQEFFLVCLDIFLGLKIDYLVKLVSSSFKCNSL